MLPSNTRAPLMSVGVDASEATQGPALLAYRALIVGQRTTAGTAPADTVHRITSATDALTLCGRGSLGHRMALAWYASNTSTEAWIGVLDDNVAGVAASGTITVNAGATADGTIALYVGGVRITAGVSALDTPNDIAASINAAINANLDLGVTATVLLAVVTVTYRHKGEVGNSFDIRHSANEGESLPEGVTLTIVQPTGGTSNPDLSSLIAVLGDSWYQIIAHPYTDSVSLTSLETELESRADNIRQIPGVAITSASGTFGTLAALGSGRNSEHSSIVAQPGINPMTPPSEFAAEVAAIVALYGSQAPARPFQTLATRHTVPVKETDRFTYAERNLLLYDGIATTLVSGERTRLERMITTYQTNAAGADDTAYLDVNTMLTLLYLRYSFRNRMQTRYPRHSLTNDGTRTGPGQFVMTPKLGETEALGWFREMEELALVEDYAGFKLSLQVYRDPVNVNMLVWKLPVNLANQLRFVVGTLNFRL